MGPCWAPLKLPVQFGWGAPESQSRAQRAPEQVGAGCLLWAGLLCSAPGRSWGWAQLPCPALAAAHCWCDSCCQPQFQSQSLLQKEKQLKYSVFSDTLAFQNSCFQFRYFREEKGKRRGMREVLGFFSTAKHNSSNFAWWIFKASKVLHHHQEC